MRSDWPPNFAFLDHPHTGLSENKRPKLNDILMIAFHAVLCGIEELVGKKEFVREKAAWLRRFLEL